MPLVVHIPQKNTALEEACSKDENNTLGTMTTQKRDILLSLQYLIWVVPLYWGFVEQHLAVSRMDHVLESSDDKCSNRGTFLDFSASQRSVL